MAKMKNPYFKNDPKGKDLAMKKAKLQKVPLFRPSLGKEELKELAEVFKSGWIGLGPKTAEFEERFAQYIGTSFAIGLNSCTAALHL